MQCASSMDALHSGIMPMVCIPARSDGNPVYTSAPIASDDQNDPGDEEEDFVKMCRNG